MKGGWKASEQQRQQPKAGGKAQESGRRLQAAKRSSAQAEKAERSPSREKTGKGEGRLLHCRRCLQAIEMILCCFVL